MRPTSKGSVGSAMPIPPRSISSRLMESGVAKATKYTRRSTAVSMAQALRSTMGSALNQ